MTKKEQKNKYTERAKIFQQAMESCKSSSPMDCIEWFADRIAELETMLHGWAKKCADLESTKEELVKSNQTIRLKLRTLKNDYEEYETAHIALVEKYRELEKENAELRKDKEELCHSISEGGKACVYLNEQLTKAKEIIKILYGDCKCFAECEDAKLGFWEEGLSKAEAFLNSEVEK